MLWDSSVVCLLVSPDDDDGVEFGRCTSAAMPPTKETYLGLLAPTDAVFYPEPARGSDCSSLVLDRRLMGVIT